MKIKNIKHIESHVTVSTWQSIKDMPSDFFNQYDMIVVDEAHQAKANSITGIMEKATDVPLRFGMTGTLSASECKCDKLVLQGLFGPICELIKTKQLMDRGQVAPLKIDTIFRVESDPELCKIFNKMDYRKEIDYLINDPDRNKFIIDLAASLTGNTLVLVNYVDKHGKVLYNMAEDKLGGSMPVHHVFGKTSDAEMREEIRQAIETYDNSVTIASYGVFSTGINIKKLDNIIFASPSKSAIRVLQSIGRGLRLADGKEHVRLFDIIDNYKGKYTRNNYSLKHGLIRCGIYDKQAFDYRIINLNT